MSTGPSASRRGAGGPRLARASHWRGHKGHTLLPYPLRKPQERQRKEAPGGRAMGPQRYQGEIWGPHPVSIHPTLTGSRGRGGRRSRGWQCRPPQGCPEGWPRPHPGSLPGPSPTPFTAYAPRTGVSHRPAAHASGPAAARARARGPGARPGPAEAHGCPGSRPQEAVPAPAWGSRGSAAPTSPGGLGPLGMGDGLLRGPPTGRDPA